MLHALLNPPMRSVISGPSGVRSWALPPAVYVNGVPVIIDTSLILLI